MAAQANITLFLRLTAGLMSMLGVLDRCAAQSLNHASSVRRFGDFTFDTEGRQGRAVRIGTAGNSSMVQRSDGRIFVNGVSSSYGTYNVPPPPPGLHFTDVSYGGFCMALVSDGTVVKWGREWDLWGPPTLPTLPSGTRFVQVAAGGRHALLLRSDGVLLAVGNNALGQCNIPMFAPGLTVQRIQAYGGGSIVWLSDGSLVAWGDNSYGRITFPPLPTGTRYTSVALARTHTAALRSDGAVLAWGDNTYGQCNVPVLPQGTTYLLVGANESFSAALRSDGVFVAWGANNGGQCNVAQIPSGLTCVELACGFAHTIVRYSDGSVGGWGFSAFTDWFVPSRPVNGHSLARIIDAAAGWSHSAIVYSDGSIAAFGENAAGQCNVPPLAKGLRYERVKAEVWHSAALRSDGMVVAWGDNSVGQCNVPPLPAGMVYVDFSLGNGHTVLLRSDGNAIAFGDNTYGVTNLPALPAGLRYVAAEAQYGNTMLLRSDGSIVVIGAPGYGLLNVPPPGAGLAYVDMAVCGATMSALRSDGTIAFWGAWQGGSFYWRPLPPLPQGVYYVEIDGAGADSLTVARRSDGQIAWQGERSPYFDYIPPLAPGTSYVQVSAHYRGDVLARVGPTSTYISFARGCAGSRPITRLVPRETPRIGKTHEVTLFDLPHSFALMLFGWSRQSSPLPLGAYGMPGCTAHVSPDGVYAVVGQNNQAKYFLPIPNDPLFVGMSFFNQAVVLDSNAGNALGAVVSDAAEGVIGHW